MDTFALDTTSLGKGLAEAEVGEATISWLMMGELEEVGVTRLDKESDGEDTSLLLPFVLTTQLPIVLRVTW